MDVQFGRALGFPFTTNNSFFKGRNVGLSGIQSVRYRNEQRFRCQNKSCTGIRGPSPVPECSGTWLRYRCRRHRPRCRCPAMLKVEPNFTPCFSEITMEAAWILKYLPYFSWKHLRHLSILQANPLLKTKWRFMRSKNPFSTFLGNIRQLSILHADPSFSEKKMEVLYRFKTPSLFCWWNT